MSLAIHNIEFRYEGNTVLKNVTYHFKDRAITAVLGKSGSGKSTLLQLLNGMLRPLSGEVLLFDRPFVYRNAYKLRRKIGYVIQHAGLFPHLTLEHNIGLAGRASGMDASTIRNRVRELMDKVRLPENYREKYPHELSGGEQQRGGLCRALLLDPPVLLMDEPFASLDSDTRNSIYEYMIDIQRQEPRTVVLVTHDLSEGIRLADRFILIEEGTIKEEGGKKELEKLHSSNSSK